MPCGTCGPADMTDGSKDTADRGGLQSVTGRRPASLAGCSRPRGRHAHEVRRHLDRCGPLEHIAAVQFKMQRGCFHQGAHWQSCMEKAVVAWSCTRRSETDLPGGEVMHVAHTDKQPTQCVSVRYGCMHYTGGETSHPPAGAGLEQQGVGEGAAVVAAQLQEHAAAPAVEEVPVAAEAIMCSAACMVYHSRLSQ